MHSSHGRDSGDKIFGFIKADVSMFGGIHVVFAVETRFSGLRITNVCNNDLGSYSIKFMCDV